MIDDREKFEKMLQEQLATLPPVVRKAIASSELEANLRELANSHKLHVDQWEDLEHEVMLTLVGIKLPEELQQNIVSEVGVTNDVAEGLAQDINRIVFEPIREELERQLEHPDAKAATVTDAEAARSQILDSEHANEAALPATDEPALPQTSSEPKINPATPPAPPPQVKIARPSGSSAYKPGEASHERASIHDDPYRESPV